VRRYDTYDTAWQRVLACFVDGILFVPLLPLLYYCSLPERSPAVIASASILWWVFGYSYLIISIALFGQTLGKKLLGIKVLAAATRRLPTLKQAVLRVSCAMAFSALELGYLLYLVSAHRYFLSAERQGWFADNTGFLNVLWCLADAAYFVFVRRHRALHDFIAGTIVVRMDAPGRQRHAPGFHKHSIMDV